MRVFYVNVGGGEPLVRRDFLDLVDYAVERRVGVKFSTNGALITPEAAAADRRHGLPRRPDLDRRRDRRRPTIPSAGAGSYAMARRGMDRLAEAGFGPFKISVVMTRHNIPELDALEAIATEYGAQLRLTRLRPSGRGASVWDELHPTAAQQRELYEWLVAPSRGPHRRQLLSSVRSG